MLVRLLYTSRMLEPDNTQAIENILTQARRYNPKLGITGVLVFGDGLFLQALEGGRNQVSELYGHIVKDPRHKDVVLLGYEEITERRFGHDQHLHANEILRNRRAQPLRREWRSVAGADGRVNGQRGRDWSLVKTNKHSLKRLSERTSEIPQARNGSCLIKAVYLTEP
jgi:Sensors of blue-light using FAD